MITKLLILATLSTGPNIGMLETPILESSPNRYELGGYEFSNEELGFMTEDEAEFLGGPNLRNSLPLIKQEIL